MTGKSKRFLIFSLSGKRYALPVEDLAEVMETPQTFPIPKAPAAYLGVMNFHGAPVPILDLATLLLGTAAQHSGRILVLDQAIGSLAMRIDTVERIISTIRGLRLQPDDGIFVRQSLLFNSDTIPILAVDLLMEKLEDDLRNEITGKERNKGTQSAS